MTRRDELPWALILAGGDGSRLRPLTTQITGDDRPKQFCPLFDGETLLERTRHRVNLVARFDHQIVVVNRDHETYYRDLTVDLAPGRLVVQPGNCGTAPGIVYPLLRVADLAGDVPVAVFPCDHDVSDDLVFMDSVQNAVNVTQRSPDLVVLLGIEAESPETEYGWIEHGPIPLPIEGQPAFPVRHFWEKPSADLARVLLDRGCLWNSFVMVGRLGAFLGLVRAAFPALIRAFQPVRRAMGSPREASAAARVYRSLPSTSFSDRVLTVVPSRLAAVRVKGVQWSDWGRPERVLASLDRAGRRPNWLSRVRFASSA